MQRWRQKIIAGDSYYKYIKVGGMNEVVLYSYPIKVFEISRITNN